MSLPRWIGRLAQQWLPRGGKRRQVRPCLEVLEDRLTPSGDVLAFTTAPQCLALSDPSHGQSEPSHAITVQLQNGSGKAIAATSNMTINLSSTSSGGQFLDTSGFALKNSQLIIPKGASSASFEYEDSQIGLPTVLAKATALNAGASQQESVGVFLVFPNPPPTVTPGQASLPITIQLYEQSNGPFFASSPITIQLTSSSGTGQFLDLSGKALPGGRLTIAAGSNSAQFEYEDTKAGLPKLTASLNGYSATTQVDDGVSLVFTTPAQNLKAGQMSQTITVQLQDPSGKAVTAPNSLGFYVSSSSQYGTFFDSKGNPAYSYYSLPPGTSSVSFRYEDSVGGKPLLTANVMSMNGLGIGAEQQETVAGPYNVRLEAPPQTIAPNQRSQPITVQLFDSSGHVVTTSSAVIVQLTSSSRTGLFLDTSGKVLPGGRLTIRAGSSSAQFQYQDSQAGLPALTATENGASDTTQVNVGVSLVFITPPQNLKAGQKSHTITVQLQDPNGKAFASPGIMPLYLTSNSQTGRFFDPSGNPLLYGFTLQSGASSVSFQYEDSVGGKPTLTAAAVTFNQLQISTTQKETVAGLYNPNFVIPPTLPAIVPNKPSQPITVQLLDSTGNVATASSTVIVQLSSSSSTGKFLDASGNVLPGGRLTIRAGSSSAQFQYEDSKTGFSMLTATENGFTASTRVNVGVSLVFTTPAQSFKTGQSSGTITLQLQDSHGKPFIATSPLGIYLSSSLSTVQFLGLTSPAMFGGYVTILPGSSSASFAITSSWGGTPTLTASMPGLALTATQQETIQGLSTLAFTTPPQTLTAGQKSQRVTLQLEDNNGRLAVAPSGGLRIYLAGNPIGGLSGPAMTFFDTNGKPLPTSSPPYFPSFKTTTLLMPAGSSTLSFEFESTQAGSIPVSAQVSAGPSWKQVETVQAGSPHSLVFVTPAQAQLTGVSSGSVTVQLQDQYGNPIVAGSGGLTFALHSSSRTGAFLSADGDPLAGPTITVPQGLSSATFEYKDSRVGTPTLTVSADGISGTQTESITPIAAEIHVTSTKDSGSGSLRAAIAAANAKPGSTIVFDAGVRGTIDLLSALPAITANMNILGPGANLLTIERSAAAATDFGIFVVGTSSVFVAGVSPVAEEPSVVISGLTLANATESGITNMGYLTLQRVVVRNNQVPVLPPSYAIGFPFGWAGGIGNTGNLTVLNSTIANNSTMSTAAAAGIDSESVFGSSPVLTVLNSTISGNRGASGFRAGGIGVYGGTAVIENSTISSNAAGQQAGLLDGGGGIDSDGNVVLYDTLVAGNTGSLANPTDVSGAFLSLGHNLIGKANPLSSGFVASDLLGTIASPMDPKLGPLANNGGPTPTMALLTGSPAIGTGTSAFAPDTDQRGDPRPQGAIDIGAFEITTS
jgi:hypothetical protein